MKFMLRSSVLIVDNKESNINILTKALSKDYYLMVARCGENALDFVRKGNPDLILLNVMMPDMDKSPLCHLLQNSFIACDIPVLFVTAIDDIENITKGFESGAVDYITTPFNILEVRTRVKTHLILRNSNITRAISKSCYSHVFRYFRLFNPKSSYS